MSIEACVARMCVAASLIAEQSGDGALHAFVADGNCEDEMLEFCLGQPSITNNEKQFVMDMLSRVTEEERFGAWAIAQEMR